MRVERCVVDNRVFLLGLDELYRQAIKWHERQELFTCAQRVVDALGITAADVPIEGDYADDPQLTEYFRMMRALQDVDERRTSDVKSLPEFRRLLDVASAPLYGHPRQRGKLLPVGRDALSQALIDTQPEWSLERLTEAARTVARETDDISLVGLAARIRDPVVLAALRESVVLYAEDVVGCAPLVDQPRYIWKVEDDLAEQAKRFIPAFHELFGDELPPPEPAQAERYWNAYESEEVYGRCVRIGSNDSTSPVRHPHWAIYGPEELAVQEFWHEEVWTTDRCRNALHHHGLPPDL
ncbi:MAG: hypothetical protein ACYTF8_02140 [Planctomycetota bacterium]|jgi:hypothetical protein